MSRITNRQFERLLRFRARMRAMLTRRLSPMTAVTTLDAPVPKTPPKRVAQTQAQHLQGTARSVQGHTSPWLLLPAERDYRLYVPAHAKTDTALPLVVMVHGCRQTSEEFALGSGMNALADAHGFAVLYPEQATLANIRRCWNWFEPNTAAGFGECALILDMIAQAEQSVALDARRIYAAGLSSGAALVSLLGYHHPQRFAAIASHSGLPPLSPPSAAAAIQGMEKGVRVDYRALTDSYWNTHEVTPPPLLVLQGDEDRRVSQRNATALLKLWHTLWQAAPQAVSLQLEQTATSATATSRATTETHWRLNDQPVLSGVRIHGLEHAWSGGDAQQPFFDAKGPSASALMWTFFQKQLARV